MTFQNLAYTDETNTFLNLRSRHHTVPVASAEEDISVEYPLKSDTDSDIELGMGSQEPEWMLALKEAQEDMKIIRLGIQDLSVLHEQHAHFKVKTDSRKEKQKIDITTQQLQKLFKMTKNRIDSIQYKPRSLRNQKQITQQDLMIKNTKQSLMTELTELARDFRTEQQAYLKGMERLKSKKKELTKFDDDADLEDADEKTLQQLQMDGYDFTDDQVQQLVHNQQDIIRRDKELRDVLHSITELQELFGEFSSLVIEQGTMLDRIDHNVELAHSAIKKGNENLTSAESYQKWGGKTLCIIALVLFLLIVILALIAKFAYKIVLKIYFPML
ncbi:SNARE syntaxin 16 [Acrasis kona]|uniref:SNARE syntaxin 16 n=1 Tax=Acrasis kona TaxID=1008807 RepID=A0AAW2ZBZ8_9EUKA